MAYTWSSCDYVAVDGDSNYISGLQCDTDNLGTFSYVFETGSGTIMGSASELGAMGNCTYGTWDSINNIITSLNCPSYVTHTGAVINVTLTGSTFGATPEEWGAYLEPRFLPGVGFVIVVFFFYFMILGSLWFGIKYGFYFFSVKR